MAKQILVQRQGYRLVPADPFSYELIETLKEGVPYNLELKQARNIGSLRKYWAGLALLVHNFDDHHAAMWPTPRHMHEALLEALGYTYRLFRIDGTFKVMVDSVALDKMSEEDWKVLLEKVTAILVGLFGYDPFEAWVAEKEAEQANKRDWRKNWRPGDE